MLAPDSSIHAVRSCIGILPHRILDMTGFRSTSLARTLAMMTMLVGSAGASGSSLLCNLIPTSDSFSVKFTQTGRELTRGTVAFSRCMTIDLSLLAAGSAMTMQPLLGDAAVGSAATVTAPPDNQDRFFVLHPAAQTEAGPKVATTTTRRWPCAVPMRPATSGMGYGSTRVSSHTVDCNMVLSTTDTTPATYGFLEGNDITLASGISETITGTCGGVSASMTFSTSTNLGRSGGLACIGLAGSSSGPPPTPLAG